MIKRLVYGLICAARYLAGVASNPRAAVTAQGQQGQQAQPGGGGGLRALAPPTRAAAWQGHVPQYRRHQEEVHQ